MVDNYHTWRDLHKALIKLNYTFVKSSLGYRNYRGVDGYTVQIPEDNEIPAEFVIEWCENRIGMSYRTFLMLITEK